MAKDMSKELKPCWCKGKAEITTIFGRIGISCTECGLNLRGELYQDQDEEIERITLAWNTRADPWISVEDRLPEKPKKNEDYFFKEKYGSYQARTLFNSTYDMIKGDLRNMFTHWMPIPELPKKG